MKLSLFDYHLPRELIAQFPSHRREQSRLLVLHRDSGRIEHRRFRDLPAYLTSGDALVVNNTRVFKARLLGRRSTGGLVEIFLVRRIDEGAEEIWEALTRPSRRLKSGEPIEFGSEGAARLVHHLDAGRWLVAFGSRTARERIIRHHGHVPLPQYIRRADERSDIRRYQTVFARSDKTGAVAAPTAGFHFTRPLLKRLDSLGVGKLELTLHVGPGTFKPIVADDIDRHVVDPEYAELSPQTARELNRVRQTGGRVFAVGTTSTRTLESAPMKGRTVQPFAGMVNLYIKPGHRFRVVDHLITNFHLPRSSLLVLVCAFAGRECILDAYREAIDERYRFYSYGDAMLIL